MIKRLIVTLMFMSLLLNFKAYASPLDVRDNAINGGDISSHIGNSLGTFKTTGYCSCPICNGEWYGHPTKLGTGYTEGLTIAVDPSYIPLGAYVWINIQGVGWRLYQAQDIGSAIRGNRIDIYVGDNHSKCTLGRYNNITEVRAYIP